ncbi:unnamed protein product [Cladocopium goreaui]|uniref:Uncharacterized protein n=1 Tax=Cladocopium goreaui TaxID=2562237 RepID=A0A9P1CSB9_9DINO|nr:unnamed protein product [Cladocopium goreaui]
MASRLARVAALQKQLEARALRRFARRFAAAAERSKTPAPPRWPFLRSKRLTSELSKFFDADGPDGPRELWVAGGRGSGASTAIQAAVGSSKQTIFVDAEKGEDVMQDTLRRRLAEILTNRKEVAVETMLAAVLEDFPKASRGLVASLEAVAGRLGLPTALPSGVEVPACRELLEKHRQDPLRLAVSSCQMLAQLPRLQLSPPSAVHVALALLSDAGRREGGASSAVDFLFSAARGCQTDLPVVLLRAHAAREGLVESIRKTGGGLRVLIQSYDAFASVRAAESGVPVLTSDEWSQDMARAIFLPRFIPEQEAQDWPAVWEAVGGHPAHLRQLSELIVEERKVIEAERLQEEKEEEQAERHRQKLRPGRNPDAEEYLEIAKQQSRDDSFRADARQPEGAVELVLRRLPELMKEEIDAVERQLQRFAVHPSLPGLLPSGSGKRVAALNLKLKELAEGVAVEGGFQDVDPLALALLETNLLVPKWHPRRRLVTPNQLTRSLLASRLFCGETGCMGGCSLRLLEIVNVFSEQLEKKGLQLVRRIVSDSVDAEELPSSGLAFPKTDRRSQVVRGLVFCRSLTSLPDTQWNSGVFSDVVGLNAVLGESGDKKEDDKSVDKERLFDAISKGFEMTQQCVPTIKEHSAATKSRQEDLKQIVPEINAKTWLVVWNMFIFPYIANNNPK